MDLCRVDFALIPDQPLFGQVINASQAITDEYYYNANIIDEKKFPPHVSLLICVVPRDRIDTIADGMSRLATSLPELVPAGIDRADGGYVMLGIERTDELMALHLDVLELAAEARDGLGADRYGSQYVRDLFSPHLSLAKVDGRDQAAAVRIGRDAAGALTGTPSRAFELCDIGERSERWDVLASYPPA